MKKLVLAGIAVVMLAGVIIGVVVLINASGVSLEGVLPKGPEVRRVDAFTALKVRPEAAIHQTRPAGVHSNSAAGPDCWSCVTTRRATACS